MWEECKYKKTHFILKISWEILGKGSVLKGPQHDYIVSGHSLIVTNSSKTGRCQRKAFPVILLHLWASFHQYRGVETYCRGDCFDGLLWLTQMLQKLILDLGKCPNQKMHESESACFLVWALPAVQNQFSKQFSKKVLYNYCLEKNIEAFWSVFEKV